MAYGQLVSYEETATPGAYRFVDRSGNKTMLTGGPAEDLKKRLDASASLMPELAANGAGGKPAARLDAGGGLSGSARVAAMNQAAGSAAQSLDEPAPPPVPGGRVGTTVLDVPRDEQGQTVAERHTPRYVQTASGPGGSIIETRVGADLNNPKPGDVRISTPARAGSKGGLALRGETRQGVQPLDEDFLEEQDDLQVQKQEAQEAGNAAALEKAEHDRAFREEMENQAINNQAQAEARDREITAKVGDLQKKYDSAEKDVASAKVDPRGGSNIFDIIAIGLGTAGAVIGKHENFALNIVQRKIDRHIAAQEHAINIKRETKNDLARMLEANQGNRELARLALQSAYTKKAQATFEARAAGSGSQELKAQHAMTAASMAEQYSLKRQAWENAARGEVTQSFVNVPGQAASAGGVRLPTLGELEGIKKASAPENKDPSGAGAAGSADKAKRMSAINSSLVALDEYVETSAAAGDLYSTKYGDDASKKAGAAAGAMGPMIARATEGDAATKDSMDRVIGGLTATNPASRDAAIKAYKAQLLRQKAAIESE
jgi:hypothetical protein